MKPASVLRITVTAFLMICVEQARSQTAPVTHKSYTGGASSALRNSAAKPAAQKKLTFKEDTFSSNRNLIYARGHSLTPNDVDGLKKEASDGAPESMYLLGAYSLHSGDEATAKQWWS